MLRTQQLNGHSKRPQWFGDSKHGAGALAINDAGDSGDPLERSWNGRSEENR